MATKEIGSVITPNMRYASAAEIDTNGCEALLFTAPTANGTSVAVTECDTTGGTYSDVAEANIKVHDDDGVLSGNDVAYTDTGVAAISYCGKKRYVKFTVTSAVSNTSLCVIKAFERYAPVDA
jgi:hypothetical protein